MPSGSKIYHLSLTVYVILGSLCAETEKSPNPLKMNKVNAGHFLVKVSAFSFPSFKYPPIIHEVCSWGTTCTSAFSAWMVFQGVKMDNEKFYFPVCRQLWELWLIYLLPLYSPHPRYPTLFQPLPLLHFHCRLQK